MEDFRWASARQQMKALREGAVSATELHEMSVSTIERLDPLLHAVVSPLFDRPRNGVPMLLKDAGQEIAGTPHWVGVSALRDSCTVSTHTTALVERFEECGFSIIGKGACPQLSLGATTEPPGFEPTRNPWDRSRSVGGSSGGPAAAVASGMVPVAHGSDATGSLRIPAALCGVATLNPTSGRIPAVLPAGQPPNDRWREFVLARHAEDLSLVFEQVTKCSPPETIGRLRVGLLDHDPEFGFDVHDACQEAVHIAGRVLEDLGHYVDVSWPNALDHLWGNCFASLQMLADDTRPGMIAWVSERLGRPVERGELGDWVFDAAERSRMRRVEEVSLSRSVVAEAGSTLLSWWENYDLLLTPTTFEPAWSLGTETGPTKTGTLLAPFSLSGQPSLSLPLHETEDGLPVGVQLVGRRGSDEVLLRLAETVQSACDWTVRRPRFGP